MQSNQVKKRQLPISPILWIAIIAVAISGSSLLSEYVKGGLSLCLSTVIPSLFPFMIISALITVGGYASDIGRFFEKPLRLIFGTSPCASCAAALGFLCGYPVGALSASEMLDSGDSWIGPAFRERASKVRGHLETAHLSIALSLALDLCKDAFTAEEYALCADALKKHAIPLCRAWLDTAPHFINNWNAVLTCGVALPAAVLGLEDELEFCHKYLQKVADLLQSDGTYGEGLQYGNYYLWVFLLANEALIRSGYDSAPLERAGRYLEYCHYNLLTDKPLEKWGAYKRPRSFNFDDSTVIFAPNPDLLALLGSRLADSMPQHAALARKIMALHLHQYYVKYR